MGNEMKLNMKMGTRWWRGREEVEKTWRRKLGGGNCGVEL